MKVWLGGATGAIGKRCAHIGTHTRCVSIYRCLIRLMPTVVAAHVLDAHALCDNHHQPSGIPSPESRGPTERRT